MLIDLEHGGDGALETTKTGKPDNMNVDDLQRLIDELTRSRRPKASVRELEPAQRTPLAGAGMPVHLPAARPTPEARRRLLRDAEDVISELRADRAGRAGERRVP
jgi:hypothetical protein